MARSQGRGPEAKRGAHLKKEGDDQYGRSLRGRSLGFDDKPKYSYLRRIFGDLFVRQGFRHDRVFDWTILKYMMERKKILQGVDALPKRVAQARNLESMSSGDEDDGLDDYLRF